MGRRDTSRVLQVVPVDMRTLRVRCCFHETQPHSCTSHRSYFRSTASFSCEPVSIQSHCERYVGYVTLSRLLFSMSNSQHVAVNMCIIKLPFLLHNILVLVVIAKIELPEPEKNSHRPHTSAKEGLDSGFRITSKI